MNIIYGYIQNKIIEKVIGFAYNTFVTVGYKKTKDKIYDLVYDGVWNQELQKYYLGDVYIEISNNEQDLVKISNGSLDEIMDLEGQKVKIYKINKPENENENKTEDEIN